ncbi:MAG: glycosyltransferase [Pseudomonadota bacterium]
MAQTITIIIAAYNAESSIERALRSALDQTCRPNVIVVDDASTDNTARRIGSLLHDEPRGTLLRQNINQGPSAARNRAIEAAKTDWIAIIDADDAMVPDRLERLLAMAEANAWDAIADDQYRISSWAPDAPRRRLWSDSDIGQIELSLARFVRENIMEYAGFGRELGFIKPLIKRDFLSKNDLRYDADMRLGEDYDLYARMLLHGAKFGLVDPCGYLAFDTPGSLSRTHRSEALEKLVRSDQRLLRHTATPQNTKPIIIEHMRHTQKKAAWAKLGEAYHERNPLKAASSFIAPWDVVTDLTSRAVALAGQKLKKPKMM